MPNILNFAQDIANLRERGNIFADPTPLKSPLQKYPTGEDQAVQSLIKQSPAFGKLPEDTQHQLFYNHGFSVIPPTPTPNVTQQQQQNPIQGAIQQVLGVMSPNSPHAQAVQQATLTPTQAPNPIQAAIKQAFPDDPETARAVAMQESSLRPDARNTIPDRNIDAIGLMQINLPAHLKEVPGDSYEEKAQNLMNPTINLKVAQKIYQQQGWNPWEAFTSGAYKKYLN